MRNVRFEALTRTVCTTVARLISQSHARARENFSIMLKCDTVVQNQLPAINGRPEQYMRLYSLYSPYAAILAILAMCAYTRYTRYMRLYAIIQLRSIQEKYEYSHPGQSENYIYT